MDSVVGNKRATFIKRTLIQKRKVNGPTIFDHVLQIQARRHRVQADRSAGPSKSWQKTKTKNKIIRLCSGSGKQSSGNGLAGTINRAACRDSGENSEEGLAASFVQGDSFGTAVVPGKEHAEKSQTPWGQRGTKRTH